MNIARKNIRSDILYEDKDIIVCHKPAGIPTQSNRVGTQDMVSILKNHIANGILSGKKIQTSSSSRQAPYLAVIHRLDQPVEGILVFAKTPAAARILNRQLTSDEFGKYYLAEVRGCPPCVEDVLNNYIIKNGQTNMSEICSADTVGAKSAILRYKVRYTRADVSLLEIKLNTGRHHQIRAQLSHLGCPITGDRKYGDKKSTGRLGLCAFKLSFRHPLSGQPADFELNSKELSAIFPVFSDTFRA